MKLTLILTLCFAALFSLVNFVSGGYLVAVLKWRLSPKKWKGKRIFIQGKMRYVTGEKFDIIFVKGIRHAIRKDNRYLKTMKDGSPGTRKN
jgi:hypothetical protein